MPEMELLVLDTIDANREYTGKYPDISTWPYWYIVAEEEGEENELVNLNEINRQEIASRHPEHSSWYPVTKPYYYGWKIGVRVDFNGTIVDVSSGLTDEDSEWLSTNQAQELIANGQLYAVIKVTQVTSLGALRHPVVKKLCIKDSSIYKVISVDHSGYEEYEEFETEEEAIDYAEHSWDDGEGGNSDVIVEKISVDYSDNYEESDIIWERHY